MTPDEVAALVARGSSADEIRQRVGRRFLTRRGFRHFLERSVRAANKDRVAQELAKPLEDIDELPYTEVRRDGITYRVHGVVHDQPRFGLRMSAATRDRVRAFVEAMQDGYVLEGGFSKSFGLPKERELRMGSAVFGGMGPGRVFRLIGRLLVTAPVWPFARFLVRFESDVGMRELFMVLDDLRRLPRARLVYRLTNLPDPLAEEVGSPTLEGMRKAMSVAIAEGMRVAAERNGWNTVHAVVGFLHEDQIVRVLHS